MGDRWQPLDQSNSRIRRKRVDCPLRDKRRRPTAKERSLAHACYLEFVCSTQLGRQNNTCKSCVKSSRWLSNRCLRITVSSEWNNDRYLFFKYLLGCSIINQSFSKSGMLSIIHKSSQWRLHIMVFSDRATNTSSISISQMHDVFKKASSEQYLRLYVNMPGEMANWLSPVSLPPANCQLAVFKSYIYSAANLHAIRFALALNLWSTGFVARVMLREQNSDWDCRIGRTRLYSWIQTLMIKFLIFILLW